MTKRDTTEKGNKNMITTAVSYDHPASGMYNETVATLADGSTHVVNAQYERVIPMAKHVVDCELLTKMGGRCTCGLLDGVDVDALVVDARANGKFGRAPRPKLSPEEIERNQREIAEMDADRRRNGLCEKCGTYCCGDCEE